MGVVSKFSRANRVPVAIAAVAFVLGPLSFQYLLGLNGAVAVLLIVAILGTTFGIYRWLNRSPVVWDARLRRGRLAFSAVAAAVVIGLAIQAIPFGWDRTNPPVTAEPAWDSLRTRELTVRACFDCHSNEVDYPWYSKIAPMSWAVQLHVDSGRGKVNYSEWDRPQKESDESVETVIKGEMPPRYYTLLTHSDANLDDAEMQELIDGLKATFGSEDDAREDEEHDDDD